MRVWDLDAFSFSGHAHVRAVILEREDPSNRLNNVSLAKVAACFFSLREGKYSKLFS